MSKYKISIELERSFGIFYAGEVVRGTVKLNCPSSSVSCRSFNIQLKGQAKVHWHTGSGDNRTDYHGHTLFQDQRFTVQGNFFKTGIFDEAGENAYFEKIHNLGVLQIPCSSTETKSMQLIVRAMDYDWGKKDDLLGEILLDVPALANSGEKRSFPLTRNGKPGKGEMTLSAKFLPYEAMFPMISSSGTAVSRDVRADYCLVLTVHQATGLRKADMFGRNDVYIQAYRPEDAKSADIKPGKSLPKPQKKITIPQGTEITAPFAFTLRNDAPPSAELHAGDYSHIRYKVRAYIDLANWKDPFAKRIITVIPNRPIPMPLLIQPHLATEGPSPIFSSCCKCGKSGVATVKLEMSRIAYAPGEKVDMGRSTILYEGSKTDMKAQVVLMGFYQLSTYRCTHTSTREFSLGTIPLIPNVETQLANMSHMSFQIPLVYPSFYGSVKEREYALYSCLKWTYTIGIKVGGEGCATSVQAVLPVLISSAPPYQEALEQYQGMPHKTISFGMWDIFNHSVVGPDDACTTAPTITGPEDGGQTVAAGPPVKTWEGPEDNQNVGDQSSLNYQPLITTFDGPAHMQAAPMMAAAPTGPSAMDSLLDKLDNEFDKRMVVGIWVREHPLQAPLLSPNDFGSILSKVTFSLDQPSVVGELLAAFEGSNNLTCQHIVTTMNTCQYQKTEVATMMAPYARDPANKEAVLSNLDYSFDRNSVGAHHLPPLDVQQEQDVIQRVFDEAPKRERRRQRVHFEIGTPRQLGSFLQLLRNQPKHCVSLHISCHGRPQYLAFEDGWGTALPITITHLEAILKSRRSDGSSFASVFQLIFIAACKSRSIGEALRNAGASHIVCAHSDRTNINVSYVLEFSKVMYSTFLSSECVSVKEAYDLAMHEVSLYPIYRGLPPQLCLLSDQDSQDCAACRGCHGRLPIQVKRTTNTISFPKPPSYFSRDDTEVWKVLQLVKDTQDENARIIWVTGEDELGMKCTLQSACQCLEQRLETNSIEGIVWMELRGHESLCSGSYQVPMNELTHRIKNQVQDRNIILVLDALGCESVPLLVDNISTLIETTEHIKCVIINSEALHLTWNCEDRHISIPALGLESTVKIFGRLCRHVMEERAPGIKCSTTLWNELTQGMLLGEDGEKILLSYSRYRVLYKAFGNGKLNNVVNSARTMPEEHFLQCVSLGYCRSLDALHSRYLLLKYCHTLQSSICKALDKKRHDEAQDFQARLATMALVLQEAPSMTELWAKLESVSKDLREFLRQPCDINRRYAGVSRLREKEQDLKRQIQQAACFRVQLKYTVADLGICTQKERELELIVDFTNDLLLQYQIHQGDYEREALLASLEHGSDTIASLQTAVENGLKQPQTTLFSSLECLPLRPDEVDCDQHLLSLREAKRSESAIKIQSRTRGMLSRLEQAKKKKNIFLVNVQMMVQGSLQRISCLRVVSQEAEKELEEEDEIMTQISSAVSGVTEDFKRGAEDFKKGVDDLAQSLHTATTAPLSELSQSTHRSIQGGFIPVLRQVSFRVQDRWKTGAPLREIPFSKAFGKSEDDAEEESESGGSRWHTGTARHELLLPKSFG
ncbi:MAG: hypothetical protein SGBAC_004427 [Bacillariaceae sp.]